MIKRIILLVGLFGLLCPLVSEAKLSIPFQGEINSSQKKFSATFFLDNNSPLSLEIKQTAANNYAVAITVNNLQTPCCEFSTVLNGHLTMLEAEGQPPSLVGELASPFTLINRKPLSELNGQFEIREHALILKDLKIGNVRYRGSLQLIAPFQVVIENELKNVDLNDFIAFFTDQHDLPAQGSVSGKISLSGNIQYLIIKSRLTSYNGRIKDLDYQSIVLNLEGIYPKIYLSNSDVTQADGLTYALKGNLDLSARENFAKQIAALAFEPLVHDDKNNREWTLKRVRTEDQSRTTELKYLLHKNQDHDAISEGDSGMLGIEQQIKF